MKIGEKGGWHRYCQLKSTTFVLAAEIGQIPFQLSRKIVALPISVDILSVYIKKQRPVLPVEIYISLFLIYLKNLLVGNSDAETGKYWMLIDRTIWAGEALLKNNTKLNRKTYLMQLWVIFNI